MESGLPVRGMQTSRVDPAAMPGIVSVTICAEVGSTKCWRGHQPWLCQGFFIPSFTRLGGFFIVFEKGKDSKKCPGQFVVDNLRSRAPEGYAME